MNGIDNVLAQMTKDAVIYCLFGIAGGVGGVLARIYQRRVRVEERKTLLQNALAKEAVSSTSSMLGFSSWSSIYKLLDLEDRRREGSLKRGLEQTLFDVLSIIIWGFNGAFVAMAIDLHYGLSFLLGWFSPRLYELLETIVPEILVKIISREARINSKEIDKLLKEKMRLLQNQADDEDEDETTTIDERLTNLLYDGENPAISRLRKNRRLEQERLKQLGSGSAGSKPAARSDNSSRRNNNSHSDGYRDDRDGDGDDSFPSTLSSLKQRERENERQRQRSRYDNSRPSDGSSFRNNRDGTSSDTNERHQQGTGRNEPPPS